ncbi:hypothetical protein SAMN05216436_11653 [bacterium A37T11]|nr:hypothetical protein SAMN05216436_11653 [bacterium A37T11]
MKKIFGIVAMLFFTALWSTSCTPDDFALGDISVKPEDLVEGIAFKIEHDASNPNIVYLTSLMDAKYTPLWDHPQGRSQAQKVTLKIPFAGTYQVKFGVETRGGIVYGAPATFTVDALYAGFISDEMWTLLAGGAGNEKTWFLDLDAEGVSRKFLGPMYFFDNWYTWDGLHTASGDNYIDANPWDWTKAILPTLERVDKAASGAPQPGVQAWYWLADWPGNSWMTEKADFGSMTFDLKDAANVVVDQQAYGLGKTKGSFMLDVENHMIKFTDARPVHDKNRDKDAVDWSNVRLLYLTKDAMQLGIVPNGDKSAMTVYNYISKDYRDNWVPGDTPEPEPPYSGDANADLTTSTTTTKKWAMSLNNPYDWTNLSGGFLNGWKTAADYAATGWAPYDASLIKNISLSLTKTGVTTGDYVFTNGSGTPISGSYSIDDKNNIVFDKAISFTISGGISLTTTADHSLRLLSTELDALGSISGMWLGQRAADKDEYTAYHFVPQTSSAADPADAWKKAFSGKTFTPDVNWFIDWLSFPPDFTGGWTSASTFGSDYSTNSWVWDANVRAVAESASLSFSTVGNDLKITLKQTINGVAYNATGTVTIDPVKNILNFSIPLVDYSGTAASWVGNTNDKSITGSTNDWYFVSHGGSNLTNISTNGFWLGKISNSVAKGDSKDEVLAFHYILKN